VIQHWRISEKLLRDINILVKGWFESNCWGFNTPDHIINSSPNQSTEVMSLHNFFGNLELGCSVAQAQNFRLSCLYWDQAFANIEVLVRANTMTSFQI
jgi:hypothetical protein